LRSDIEIREPKTKKEFKQYYHLRWQILREPWDQPRGTEKDEFEKVGLHLAAFLNDKIIGSGRGHFAESKRAQIRWMAVDKEFQGKGIGSKLLKELEKILFNKGAEEIFLKARERAVNLYKRQGYEIYKKGEILFGEIRHYWMRKHAN